MLITASILLHLLALPLQPAVYTYVASLDSESVLLAWGTTEEDHNSIGRDSRPLGKAEVRIDGRSIREQSRNWVHVTGLRPDQAYPYQILLDGKTVADSRLRTHPRRSDRLAFLVVGDYGKGNERQRQLARAMTQVVEERRNSGYPVRLVITTGDNIYGKHLGVVVRKSGNRDSHWQPKFFEPYRELLRHIPFYPSPGNHDGDDTENKGDFPVYADNFFLPPLPAWEGSTANYYGITVAGLADFFSLDSTKNTMPSGGKAFSRNGPQHRWLLQSLKASKAPWKIVYYHNPTHNAGPKYSPVTRMSYLEPDLADAGVQVVFNGHEHNFQASEASETSGILFVVSGAGGSLRKGGIQKRLRQEGIAAWAAVGHFLLVEIDGEEMRIQAIGVDGRPVRYRLRDGSFSDAAVVVRR